RVSARRARETAGPRAQTSPRRRETLSGDPHQGVPVADAGCPDHFPGQGGRRGLPVPLPLPLKAVEVVPQWLLIETGLSAARLILVGRPEARGVGGQDLVDQ